MAPAGFVVLSEGGASYGTAGGKGDGASGHRSPWEAQDPEAHMRRALIGLMLIAPLLSGCAVGFARHSYHERYGPTSLAALGIPRGYVPPPGRCRIWLPGVPAGRQGYAGPCGRLERRVPAGGWLLNRVGPLTVELWIYDEYVPRVSEVLTFELRSGYAYDDGRYRY